MNLSVAKNGQQPLLANSQTTSVLKIHLWLSKLELFSALFSDCFLEFRLQPIILNWLRIRWYRRKLLETYVQFMLVFMFFPG
ncbi:hypothetical protein C3L33_17178, partial [Rhododendron williamsianum]